MTEQTNDEIVMKLLHYFITEKGYSPIVLHGAKNEIWLENFSNNYGIVRIVTDNIYNDEQFNSAIDNCNYNVTWSNPNFELWLLAHFKKVSRYVSKDDVLQELSKEFQKKGLGDYTKNDTNIFDKVTGEGKLHTAIKNCEYMEELNKDGQASQRNPMTKVYKIVDGLKEYLE